MLLLEWMTSDLAVTPMDPLVLASMPSKHRVFWARSNIDALQDDSNQKSEELKGWIS